MVSHDKLLKDLNQTTLPPETNRWFNCYLPGRQSRTKFRNQPGMSEPSSHEAGVVTSPFLFNFYLTNLPTPPDVISIVQYADDISVYCS